MTDALETAEAAGLSLSLYPPRGGSPRASRAFDQLVRAWIPLTHVLNNLNRGLGLPDSYPFVLSTSIIAKLRFIDQIVRNARH